MLHLDQDPLNIVGTTIAEKYLVEGMFAEGGHAYVYRATHAIWETPVALKCFRSLGQVPQELRQQLLDEFIQEGRLMSRLSTRTPAIVQARDFGTFVTGDGEWVPFLVMEWLDGAALDEVLVAETAMTEPPRSLEQTIALLDEAMAALELAHQEGIAHRDIKPENLFVVGDARSDRARVKILDFGIAKVTAGELGAALLATGTEPTPFTPYYGAPEQFSRTYGATGPWTDVFAMALVLLEVMRGGRRVYESDDYVDQARYAKDPNRRPTPQTLGLEVSPEVEAVFQRAVAIYPKDRYSTIGAFWAELRGAVFPDETVWGAARRTGEYKAVGTPRPSSVTSSAPASRDASDHTPQAHATPSRRARARRRAYGLAAGAGLLVALGGAAAFLVVGSQASDGSHLAASSLSGGAESAATVDAGTAQTAGAPDASSSSNAASSADGSVCPSGSVLIPGGRFTMGSNDGSFDLWQPAHTVFLDAFCLDTHEVTVAEYRACVDGGACQAPSPPSYPKPEGTSPQEHEDTLRKQIPQCNYSSSGRDAHPINCVTWQQADAFCSFASGHLPTEAQWELAARGGTENRKHPWGEQEGGPEHMNACGTECAAHDRAQGLEVSSTMYASDDGFPLTAPVGSFPKGASKHGAMDLVGNVWEWTADWFEPYGSGDRVNPRGAATGERKAIRGGGYDGGSPLWMNPAFRDHEAATAAAPALGFRCSYDL